MDIYALNSNFRPYEVVEGFESVVWTERYGAAGDIQLKTAYSPAVEALLSEGTWIATNESDDVMQVETQELDDGILTITGPSMTGFLKQRMLRQGWTNANRSWQIAGAPGWIAGEIVREMCMPGGLIAASSTTGPLADGTKEFIPNLMIGDVAAGTSVTLAVEYGNVYDGVQAVCSTYNLGFWMRPFIDPSSDTDYDIVFSSYAGEDRTSGQVVNPLVRFDPALNTLAKTKGLRSIAAYKNVCYAYATNIPTPSPNVRIVGVAYADPSDATKSGFDRRSLYLDVSDINPADVANNTVLTSVLTQRAMDALANNNYVKLADGELVPQGNFKYGEDYFLGDIIELRGMNGDLSKARVVEYIRVIDGSGYHAYPSLSVIAD